MACNSLSKARKFHHHQRSHVAYPSRKVVHTSKASSATQAGRILGDKVRRKLAAGDEALVDFRPLPKKEKDESESEGEDSEGEDGMGKVVGEKISSKNKVSI